MNVNTRGFNSCIKDKCQMGGFFGLTASSVLDFISAAAVEMSLRMKSTLSGHSSLCPISQAARQCL